jgi:hypothetical protein
MMRASSSKKTAKKQQKQGVMTMTQDDKLDQNNIISETDSSDELTAQELSLECLLGELTDSSINSNVKVFLQPGNGREKLSYLFCCAPDDYSYSELLEKIKTEYGPGNYRIHVRSKTELLANHSVSIGSPKNFFIQSAQKNEMSEALQKIIESQQMMMSALTNAMSKSQHAAVDPLAVQNQLLQQMQIFKNFFAAEKNNANDPMQMLKIFLEFKNEIDLKKENANTNDVLISLMNNFLPQITELSKREQELDAQKISQLAQTKKTTSALPSASASHSTEAAPAGAENPLRQHLIFLDAMAKKGAHPEPYAHLLLDNTPYEQLDFLLALLKKPNFIDDLAKLHPAVLQNKKWFSDLAELTLQLIDDDADSENDATEAEIESSKDAKIATQLH